jgi:hypothetical protein
VKLINGYSPTKAQPPQTIQLEPQQRLKQKLAPHNKYNADFIRLEMDEEDEDDDDFKNDGAIEDQFMDNLDLNGKPYEYVDDDPFEEDDEVNSNEDIVLEEDESGIEGESQKTHSEFNADLIMGASSSSNMTKQHSDSPVVGESMDGKKDLRAKKKKSILKKKPSAKGKKSQHGYREDAEENKTWC